MGAISPTRAFFSPAAQWPGMLEFMIPEKANAFSAAKEMEPETIQAAARKAVSRTWKNLRVSRMPIPP